MVGIHDLTVYVNLCKLFVYVCVLSKRSKTEECTYIHFVSSCKDRIRAYVLIIVFNVTNFYIRVVKIVTRDDIDNGVITE